MNINIKSKQLVLDFLKGIENMSFITPEDNAVRVNIMDKAFKFFYEVNYYELKVVSWSCCR